MSPAKCHKDDLWDQGISPVMKGWESWGWPRWSPEVPPSLNYSGILWSCQSLCFFIESDWERYFDTSFIKITDTLFLQWSGKQKIKWSGGIGAGGGTKKPNQTIPDEVVNSPEAKTDLSTEMSSGFSPFVVQVWDFFFELASFLQLPKVTLSQDAPNTGPSSHFPLLLTDNITTD